MKVGDRIKLNARGMSGLKMPENSIGTITRIQTPDEPWDEDEEFLVKFNEQAEFWCYTDEFDVYVPHKKKDLLKLNK